jgi:hypothetical protein
MRRSVLMLAALALLVDGAGQPSARAQGSAVIHRYDDLTDIVTLQILLNGSQVTSLNQGGEAFTLTSPVECSYDRPCEFGGEHF